MKQQTCILSAGFSDFILKTKNDIEVHKQEVSKIKEMKKKVCLNIIFI